MKKVRKEINLIFGKKKSETKIVFDIVFVNWHGFSKCNGNVC